MESYIGNIHEDWQSTYKKLWYVYPEIWWHHALHFPPRRLFLAKTIDYYRYQSHPNRVPPNIIAQSWESTSNTVFFVGWIGVYFATTGPSLKAVNLRIVFEAIMIMTYCWWFRNPIPHHRLDVVETRVTISTGAGFLPWTVSWCIMYSLKV